MQYKIAQGIVIPLEGRYIKFTRSNKNEVLVGSMGTEVRFIDGETSSTYSALVPEVELSSPYMLLQSTDWYKAPLATYKIGCIEISKNTEYDYVFSQFICSGIDKYIMNYDDTQCTILVPESKIKLSKSDEYTAYTSIINLNPYIHLESVDIVEDYYLGNFYAINLSDFSTFNTSINQFVFNTESEYDKFRLRTIDVQASFLDKLGKLLSSNGIQLMKKVRDARLNTTNQISYDITTVDKQINPRNLSSAFNPKLAAQLYEMEISFEASFTDYIVMENFRRDYENYTYISNFTTFDTIDKYSIEWKSSVWWEPINTDTTLEFSTDSDGTYSFPLSFSCRIRYYNVMDPGTKSLKLIDSILANINSQNKRGTTITSDELVIEPKNIGSDGIIVDKYTKNYKIITIVSGNSVVDGGGLYMVGSTCTLKCTPNKGYRFEGWSTGSGIIYDNPYSFVITNSDLILPILKKEVDNG